MSWDLMLLPFSPEWASAEDIPGDWTPGVLGPRATVVAALTEVFPGVSEDGEGRFSLNEDWTEIVVGTEDPTESVNVYLRAGAAPSTMERLVRFASLLGTRALDIQTGEFLTPTSGAESYAKWQNWLERILESE
jgi:hypothetical protein